VKSRSEALEEAAIEREEAKARQEATEIVGRHRSYLKEQGWLEPERSQLLVARIRRHARLLAALDVEVTVALIERANELQFAKGKAA